MIRSLLRLFLRIWDSNSSSLNLNILAIIAAVVYLFVGSSDTGLFGDDLSQEEIANILFALSKSEVNPNAKFKKGRLKFLRVEHDEPKNSDPAAIEEAIKRRAEDYRNNPNKPQLTPELQQAKEKAIPFEVRYEMANSSDTITEVIFAYKDGKYYREEIILDRYDTIELPPELTNNPYKGNFSVEANKHKIYVYDGEKQIYYTKCLSNAMIYPRKWEISGPLTFGLTGVDWKQVDRKQLKPEYIQGERKVIGDSEKYVLYLGSKDDDAFSIFVLDASKDLVPVRIEGYVKGVLVGKSFQDYKKYGDIWFPQRSEIFNGRYSNDPKTGERKVKIQWRQTWILKQADFDLEPDDLFNLPLPPDVHVTDHRFNPPLRYYNANGFSEDEIRQALDLRDEAVAMLKAAKGQVGVKEETHRYCGVLSLFAVCKMLGVGADMEAIIRLSGQSSQGVSMAGLAIAARAMGTSATGVQFGLKDLQSAEKPIIVFLSQRKHFIVVTEFDGQIVKYIDLSRQTPFGAMVIDKFSKVWEGYALVITKEDNR